MKPVRVRLSKRSYDIRFGPLESGLASALRKLGFSSTRVLVVTSKAIQRAGHAKKLLSALKKGKFEPLLVVLPDGEINKNFNTLGGLYKKGFEAGLDRKSLVVALGGGVITDLAGFFASTYMRGIAYVSVPTTLLGMVDAAIGGKTGVDMREGKNLVGSFWQPCLVWIDLRLLKTLPPREWRTGFAEIIKYGLIKDAGFFSWLESKIKKNASFSRWPGPDIEKAIRRSAEIKASVVGGDERETPLGGGREILNFGHTGGHALEAAYSYRGLSHGEAISIGMNLASLISLEKSLFSESLRARLLDVLNRAGLPTRFPHLSRHQAKTFWRALSKDKKHVAGRLRFVLPIKIGRVGVLSGIPLKTVQAAVEQGKKLGYTRR